MKIEGRNSVRELLKTKKTVDNATKKESKRVTI